MGSDFTLIRVNLQNLLDNDSLMVDFAGSYFSKTKCALDLQPLDDPLEAVDVAAMLQRRTKYRVAANGPR